MFSIIVPSYNRNAEVSELLASLSAQTVLNFEVVVVDDCSENVVKTDRTYHFPVRVIRNEVNQGPARSRNIGAESAVNTWLLFLDDDDRFEPNKCEVLTNTITQHPQVNFIYHPAKCVMVNEHFTYYTKPYADVEQLTFDNILRSNKIGGMPMLAVKKDFFLQIGGLSEQLKALEDYDFVLKALKQPNFAPHFVSEALTCCYFHTKVASISKNIHNTEQALAYIQATYVENAQQSENLQQNSYAILAYPHLMSLSRQAGNYYFQQAIHNGFHFKSLIIALITWLSPKISLNLKRFI